MSTYDAYNLSLRDSTEFTVPTGGGSDSSGDSSDNVILYMLPDDLYNYSKDHHESGKGAVSNVTWNELKNLWDNNKIPCYKYHFYYESEPPYHSVQSIKYFMIMGQLEYNIYESDPSTYTVNFYDGGKTQMHQYLANDPDVPMICLMD